MRSFGVIPLFIKNKVFCDSSESFYTSPSRDDSENQAQLLLETSDFSKENPGTFDDLQKMMRDLSPSCFEGTKFTTNLPLGENSQVSLNWLYTNATPSRFYASINAVGGTKIRSNERSPALSLEFDFSKNWGLNVAYYLKKNVRLRCQLQSSGATVENTDLNCLYYGKNYTLSASVLNPSINNKSGMFALQFLRRLNKDLDIGLEIASEMMSSVIPRKIIPSLAIKYSHGINTDQPTNSEGYLSSLNIQPKGLFIGFFGLEYLHFFYSRHVAPGLQFMTSFMYTKEAPPEHAAIVSLGYQYHLSKLDLNVKASYDSTHTLQTTIEKNFFEADSGWGLSASMAHNFTQGRTMTGLGIFIGR